MARTVELREAKRARLSEAEGWWAQQRLLTLTLYWGIHAACLLGFVYTPSLGDLALCAPVIEREARARRLAPAAHYAHLLVHGVLHLQGYDHHRARDAMRMERRERRIVTRLGFADPYGQRPAQ